MSINSCIRRINFCAAKCKSCAAVATFNRLVSFCRRRAALADPFSTQQTSQKANRHFAYARNFRPCLQLNFAVRFHSRSMHGLQFQFRVAKQIHFCALTLWRHFRFVSHEPRVHNVTFNAILTCAVYCFA